MTQYLVAIHHPDDYDPAVSEDEAMHHDIDVLNDEIKGRRSQYLRRRPPACPQGEIAAHEA
jgi:hypothetical protein